MSDGTAGPDDRSPAQGATWVAPSEPAPSAPAASPYAPAGGGGGWVPPSQPGLVPLRPMTLGTILSASFRTVRRNPKPLLGFGLLTHIAVGILTAVVFGFLTVWMFQRIDNAAPENLTEITAGSILGLILGGLVPMTLGIAVAALVQGIVVLDVARATLGEKLTLRELFARGRGRYWALIGWTLLVTGVAILSFAVLALTVWLLAILFGAVGLAIGIALAIILYLGLLVLAAWLGTKLSLVPSALMVERLSLGKAMKRSWGLTHRHFWRTLGIQWLVAVMLSIAVQVVSTPASLLLPMVSVLVDPNGTGGGLSIAVTIGTTLVFTAFIMALTVVTVVIMSATNGLLYLDLRMRHEGLEVELARHVEQRDAGATGLPDPFVTPAGSAAPASTTGWQ